MMQVRVARNEEVKDFLEQEWELEDIHHYGSEVEWQEEHFLFKAIEDNLILGVIKGGLRCGVIYIDDLIVSHKHRGQGVGRSLVMFVEDWGRLKNVHKIWLYTGKGWVAEELYAALGFKSVVEMKHHFHGHDFVLMEKIL